MGRAGAGGCSVNLSPRSGRTWSPQFNMTDNDKGRGIKFTFWFQKTNPQEWTNHQTAKEEKGNTSSYVATNLEWFLVRGKWQEWMPKLESSCLDLRKPCYPQHASVHGSRGAWEQEPPGQRLVQTSWEGPASWRVFPNLQNPQDTREDRGPIAPSCGCSPCAGRSPSTVICGSVRWMNSQHLQSCVI